MPNVPNYAREMDKVLRSLEGRRPRLLLHACCGPCSSAVLEQLSQFFEITVLYYNPNTWPEAEYRRRGGPDFTPRQRAFLAHCQQAGYLTLTPQRLTLTPLGMIVQNAILEELI